MLCNVLFLTGVWRYSVLQAGLAITPGPFIAAAVARPAAGSPSASGSAGSLLAGGLVWAAGVLWLITQVGLTPDFLWRVAARRW